MKSKNTISRFRIFTFVQPILLLMAILFLSLWVLIAVSSYLKGDLELKSLIGIILYLLFFCYFFTWQLYICRYRCDVIEVDKNTIRIKKFFGIGKSYNFNLKDISILTTIENVKIGSGEKLLIYFNQYRLTELSDLCHSNYTIIKNQFGKFNNANFLSKDGHFEKLKLALTFKNNYGD